MSQANITPEVPGEHPLLTLATQPLRQLWIGSNSPLPFESVLLSGCTNFRGPSSLHRSFDVVWFYEQDLMHIPPTSLPLYLDESVRFLGEEGQLVLRYTQSREVTVFQVKRYFGRHPNLDVQVAQEFLGEAGSVTTVLRIRRLNYKAYESQDWTFAILTQGKKVSNVVSYLQSIRNEDPSARHEILVCGPPNDAYRDYGVKYLDRTYSSKFSDICSKKNDLARYATRPNLLIVHDRYTLDRGFLAGFNEYGSDFDFVTVAQRYECGTDFPSYCAMSKTRHQFIFADPITIEDVNHWYPMSFLNGGLLAFKTHNLRTLPFNELMFWGQAEDVEYSRWMFEHSLPPRINLFSSATVLGLTPEYTAIFRSEKENIVDNYEPESDAPEIEEEVLPVIPLRGRARHWVRRHFRKFALFGALIMVAVQLVTLYLILSLSGVSW